MFQLFLLHLESEIIALAAQGADDSGGCSDIQLLADDVVRINPFKSIFLWAFNSLTRRY